MKIINAKIQLRLCCCHKTATTTHNESSIENNFSQMRAFSLLKGEGGLSLRAQQLAGLSGHEFFDGFVEYACSEHKVFDANTFIYAVFQLDYFA
jgi:hypothetical protein